MNLRYLSLFVAFVAAQTCSSLRGQSLVMDSALVEQWKDNPQVRQCGLCHFSPGNDFAARDTDFVRLIEAKLWLSNDKHAIARRRIEPLLTTNTPDEKHEDKQDGKLVDKPATASQPLAQPQQSSEIAASNLLSYSIVSKLGYAVETAAGYAQFRDNCLTCHAGYQGPGYQGLNDSHEFERTSTQRPGITCSFCHQLGENTRWVDEHGGLYAKQNWRTLEPQTKASRGMRNLVTVEDQADLCLKCHIGDIKQNMFVTHQMYVAGHPPLPSIELHALLEAMPRHWRTHSELYQSLEGFRDRELYFKQNLGNATAKPQLPVNRLNWQSQTIAIGAIAAYQQSLQIAEQAASPNSKHWGDYALYDCAGCHHELKLPSPRQSARTGSTPGRPRLLEWPRVLSKAALASSEASADVAKSQIALKQAVEETPFGTRSKVAQHARELHAILSRYRSHLSSEAVTPTFAKRYATLLTQSSDVELVDYHTARQINWAMRGIDAELAQLRSPLPDFARKRIAELGIVSGVVQVESQIPGSQTREIFPAFVDAELTRQSQYDPKQFHAQLQAIGDAL